MSGISRIVIEKQHAQIGLRNTPARMRISKPQMQMRIKNEVPTMEIDRRAPTFKVNRKKINAESGLKAPDDFTKTFRDDGKAGALRATRTGVDDGNFLGNVRSPGDRVARLARNKAMSAVLNKQQTNLGLMPKSPPEVNWEKGHMRVSWSRHSLVIDWEGDYLPKLTLDPPHSVEVYLRTKPYVRIMVEEGPPPRTRGGHVDEAI